MRSTEENVGNSFTSQQQNCLLFHLFVNVRNYCFLLLLICNLSLIAQNSHGQLSAGVMPGFLLAHRSDLKNIETHMIGFELQLDKLRNEEEWSSYYRQAVTGLGLSYFHLGGEETGNALALQSNMRFDLLKLGNTYFQLRLGAGVGYLTKKFDPYGNRRNQAIGSHFNAFMQTALLFDRHTKFGNFQYGLGISHFSNAAYKMPNLGFNIPSAFFRFSLAQSADTSKLHRINSGQCYVPKTYFSANSVYGRKQRNFANPISFNNYGIQLRAVYQVNPIRAWRAGTDAALDKTYKYSEDVLVDLKSLSFSEKIEFGLAIGHEWSAGDLRFIMELGAYLYRPADLKRLLYQRMGFIYNLNEHWGALGTLKFHRGVADYMVFGLVYNLKK